MRFSCVMMIIALFVLSGCATFKVEDTSGIKSMLENKIDAEYLASKVKTERKGVKSAFDPCSRKGVKSAFDPCSRGKGSSLPLTLAQNY